MLFLRIGRLNAEVASFEIEAAPLKAEDPRISLIVVRVPIRGVSNSAFGLIFPLRISAITLVSSERIVPLPFLLDRYSKASERPFETMYSLSLQGVALNAIELFPIHFSGESPLRSQFLSYSKDISN